ncbi:dihydrolipoamide acetyltransferase family protein [Aminobacter aganoensis]|uniref:Dihydrolipoamide acetyltransferase component of pyruvate dehydrogenase complex n=1 Tax=Aminobacter aganoensis TaxID=83264 RepID=A0A7X0KN10_9HYPH|nr:MULTISPECIES: dihydrolipoamide acetyltransferase family protein [Aminobacter]KQU74215.1 branched-chain alpha-keto acid dehydrogenase subunit E2 [Aminobacter sp. DSM 101952]MBB6356686.1 2-oxoisovalerate dehydrogenase E2 component (dihydrolipoyl transacylase) [Aminobacter aganoensis]
MGEHVIKLPDVGEGVAEAELVEWHVKIGDLVREDAVLAAVMTDKATVEIPSPVDGEILWLGAEIGDTVPVGSPIVRIKVAGEGGVAATEAEKPSGVQGTPTPDPSPQGGGEQPSIAVSKSDTSKAGKETAKAPTGSPSPLGGGARGAAATIGLPRPEGERPLASPAVRLRAKEAGIDLRQVSGTGPAGRITHDDLDGFAARGSAVPTAGLLARTEVEEIKVIGLRRRIAEKMALAKSRIPHITYVEEIDVTALEELRAKLNASKKPDRPKLTLLPFLMRALVKAVAEQPQLNAIYDDDAGVIQRHAGVHIGMAAQTPGGLMVPVVRHAEARDIWDCAGEVNRLAEAAKAGTATREELTGSTITITSLGAMGGVATTPVINYPEVAIVGVNKIMIRPMWDGTQFVPRKMMNLSSSFDHRVIDGWDAAVFVQRLKALLEAPAMIFVEG